MTIDANMARLDAFMAPAPIFFVNNNVNLDDLLQALDTMPCGIVRVDGYDDPAKAFAYQPVAKEDAAVGCVAGWISEEA